MTGRDGFIVTDLATGAEVHFVACTQNADSAREKVLSGMLRNMDTDRFGVADTRWETEGDSE